MTDKCNIPTDQQASHTPGPWSNERIWDTPECRIHVLVGGVPMALAEAYTMRNAGEKEANARLIAAAPDLLASLKEMGDWIAGGLQASGEAWPDAKCLQHTEEIAARARAAVDKAEGRS
jgi:hypothetical protein